MISALPVGKTTEFAEFWIKVGFFSFCFHFEEEIYEISAFFSIFSYKNAAGAHPR